MSDSGSKSDRRAASRPEVPPATTSRPGFVTMPTELRAFQKPDPNAGALEEAEVADAAVKLRDAGRGPDVLFEDLREGPPRDPNAAADENRSEHLVVEMPAGVSPWVKDAAAAKEAAAVTIDKAALPPASAPPNEAARPAHVAPAVVSEQRPGAGRPSRLWLLGMGLAAAAVLLVVTLRPRDEPGSHDEATGGAPTALQATAMMAATTAATASPPLATGAPATTGAAPTAASARSTTTQAFTASTAPTTKPVPTRTSDPFVDAGAVPVPPPSADPTAAPAVSVAPSSKPSASSTNPWDVVFEKKKDSGNQ